MQQHNSSSVTRHSESSLQKNIEALIERSRAENQQNPVLARTYALEALHLCRNTSSTSPDFKQKLKCLSGRALLAEAISGLNVGAFASVDSCLHESIPILKSCKLYEDLFLAFEARVRLCSNGIQPQKFEEYLQDLASLADELTPRRVHAKIAQLRGFHAMRQGQYEAAKNYLLDYQEYLEENGSTYNQALLHSNFGVVYTRMGDSAKALEHHLIAIRMLQGKRDIGVAKSYGNVGNTYFVLGDSRALEYFTRSYEILLECGNKDAAVKALLGISNSLEEMGKYAESLEALQRAHNLLTEIDTKDDLILILINEANLYRRTKNLSAQLASAKRAHKLSAELKNARISAYTHLALAIAIVDDGRPEDALGHVTPALNLLKGLRDDVNTIKAMVLHAEVLGAMDEDANAMQILNSALKLSQKDGLQRVRVEVLETLAKQSKRMQRWQEATQFMQAYCDELLELQKEDTARRNENSRILQRAESAHQEAEIQHRRSVEITSALNRVSELNQNIREKNLDLERLNAEKNEFLGIAAHDLRSPINNILMLADIIINDAGTATKNDTKVETGESAEAAHLAADIQEVARQMLGMLNQLLDVNRIESGHSLPVLQPVEWKTTLHKTVSQYRPAANRKNISLHLDLPEQMVLVNVDPAFLEQVVDNLVSNAIKYSHLNGQIHLRLSVDTEQACFSVADSGPGISAAELPRLFERFQNISTNPSAGEHSVGLGLSIVQRLVTLMQGRVWCESVEGHGATFFVEFPIYQHSE